MTSPDPAAPPCSGRAHHPEALRLIESLIEEFMSRSPRARALAQRVDSDGGARFLDRIVHIQTPRSPQQRARLHQAGFTVQPRPCAPDRFVLIGADLPSVLLVEGSVMRLTIRVGSLDCFAEAMRGPPSPAIEGEPEGGPRRVMLCADKGAEFWAVEQIGPDGRETRPLAPCRADRRGS